MFHNFHYDNNSKFVTIHWVCTERGPWKLFSEVAATNIGSHSYSFERAEFSVCVHIFTVHVIAKYEND